MSELQNILFRAASCQAVRGKFSFWRFTNRRLAFTINLMEINVIGGGFAGLKLLGRRLNGAKVLA